MQVSKVSGKQEFLKNRELECVIYVIVYKHTFRSKWLKESVDKNIHSPSRVGVLYRRPSAIQLFVNILVVREAEKNVGTIT